MPLRSAPLPGPVLVTKNVMFGDCGGCGGDGCCAPAPDTTPNAKKATTDGFSFFIVVFSQKCMPRPQHLKPRKTGSIPQARRAPMRYLTGINLDVRFGSKADIAARPSNAALPP